MKATQRKKERKCSISICTVLSDANTSQAKKLRYLCSATPARHHPKICLSFVSSCMRTRAEISMTSLFGSQSAPLPDVNYKDKTVFFKHSRNACPHLEMWTAAVLIIYLSSWSFLMLMSWKGSLWLSVNLQKLLTQNVADELPDWEAWLHLCWRVCFSQKLTEIILEPGQFATRLQELTMRCQKQHIYTFKTHFIQVRSFLLSAEESKHLHLCSFNRPRRYWRKYANIHNNMKHMYLGIYYRWRSHRKSVP